MNLKNLRQWAVWAVAVNVSVIVIAGLVLPANAISLLPVLGLALSLVTSGVIDAAAQPRLQSESRRVAPARTRLEAVC
jgi:hypothetical protein